MRKLLLISMLMLFLAPVPAIGASDAPDPHGHRHRGRLGQCFAGPRRRRPGPSPCGRGRVPGSPGQRRPAGDHRGQEIAYQKLWREDADEAIFYFRRYLARHPGKENRDVLRGLALAYSWSGRQAEAIELYRQLARTDPADGGARLGLGRSLIWNNQLAGGQQVLLAMEEEFGTGTAPHKQAGNFLLTYLDDYTTPVGVGLKASWDSDDLDIYRLYGRAAFTVLGNQLLELRPELAAFRQPGRPDVTAPRLGAGLVGPLAHNWTLHAYAWLDMFRSGDRLFPATDKLDWNHLGGDLWLTWIPASRWRLDFGGSSLPVETYAAFARQLHYEQVNASADWRFARGWTWGAAGYLADYSDGNNRKKASTYLRWRKGGRWEMHLGPRLTYMDFKDAYPGGYWAPDWVRNASLQVILKTRGHRWTFKLDGSWGLEKEAGADGISVGGLSARLGWRLGATSLLALEGGHARSKLNPIAATGAPSPS
jgi:hypothetical protein